MLKAKLLSLIVPAYKQEKTIVKDIKNINKILSSLPFPHELIVVIDGFLDKTYKKAKSVKSNNIKVLGYEKNWGKGYAVKYGMLKAKGDVVGFIDAGINIALSSISILIDFMKLHQANIVVGSKLYPDSIVKYPIRRKIRTSYLIFSILSIFTSTLSGTLSSTPRYIIVVFPMFVILDLIQNRLIKDLFLAIHIVLLVLLTALFTQEYFVA